MSSQTQSNQATGQGSPAIAVLLTWLVPGGGHLYLGMLRPAVIAFVAIEGMYALGVMLSGGMFLEYLPPEMRSAFAWVLTPEIGNFGALWWHQGQYGYGYGFPRAWPSTMDIGTTLTAASGILNLLMMSRAHMDARLLAARAKPKESLPEPGKMLSPGTAILTSWLCPGLGQWLQGRRLRGVLIFAMLVGLFAVGTWLAEGSNLDRERHFYYWAGQFLLGAPAVLTEFANGHPIMTGGVGYADAGVVLASVAGLLNVMSMMDAYAYSEDVTFGRDPNSLRGQDQPQQDENPKAAGEPLPEARS
ncbi:MAG: hypothetical protein ACI835_000186 [Planctomycetota bacterium]|jgi:hypothetical protein